VNRLTSAAYGEAIGAGMAIVPDAIMNRLRHVHFLTGIDPGWAGLHSFAETLADFSYAELAHCACAHQTTDRTTTIVLPVVEMAKPDIVVHELGHALHEALGWEHDAKPVTEYATTDRFEAFAESFRAWLFWYGDQDALDRDQATLDLFERLSA
jgi:hypothetical protein